MMERLTQEKLILDLIKQTTHAVIATNSETGFPESAFIGFGETERLELIFGTNSQSRKFQNILRDPRVSFVIGGESYVTVQYEGTTRILNLEEWTQYTDLFFQKTPSAKVYENQPNQQYLLVSPKWIRYSDLRENDQAVIFELGF